MTGFIDSREQEPAPVEYATVSSAPPKRRAGRTKFRETRHPVFKGVRRRGAADRWVCELREPNKKSRIWVGTFPTPEMAARAHDVAAMALRGRAACLNFADSASLLPIVPASAGEIRRAAAAAAEAFGPGGTHFAAGAEPASAAPVREEKVDFAGDGTEVDLGVLYDDDQVMFGSPEIWPEVAGVDLAGWEDGDSAGDYVLLWSHSV
ncbi:Dehydration-responsive element-binding protein 1E [Apostasia shenzhenica]|uniref:Dehydration-responsive element-binding protein 1E n=1 Tax=Apostasia shenzhenica TaxID=1088818 RepID=A0A2H9ZSF0_9ASPA|nr:Dehydration-responsive element-binding protein 1E [Apostasia shenzhenica]